MDWFLMALKRYAVFSERSRREEYWFFTLFYLLILIGLSMIDAFINSGDGYGIGILGAIFALAMLIPSLAVSVRRLHDTGRSGWWLLIGCIPLLGGLVLLVFFCMDSVSGDNQYGPNPKGVSFGA